jgi:hypothetical protein
MGLLLDKIKFTRLIVYYHCKSTFFRKISFSSFIASEISPMSAGISIESRRMKKDINCLLILKKTLFLFNKMLLSHSPVSLAACDSKYKRKE